MVETPKPLLPGPATVQGGATEDKPVGTAKATRWWRWRGGFRRIRAQWVVAALAVLVAVGGVTAFTIDLGPSVRAAAERGASAFLNREVTIGRIGAYLVPGRFLVEDLEISGLNPGDRSFLYAGRITLSVDWSALWNGEFLVDSVSMTDWTMLAESFADGQQSFPSFVQQRPIDIEPEVVTAAESNNIDEVEEASRRFVTTLQYLNASSGEFRFEDHGSNWSVIAPNLDFTLTKILDYRGHVSFSGGTIQISDFEPMWVDMASDFELDGANVHLTRIALETDGASTDLVGDVDLTNFPEMSYSMESDIDFTRMREIFFAADPFTASGEGHFSGTFHKFTGGHDLRGAFSSEEAGINQFRFPEVAGHLRWQSDRFDVWDVVSTPYGGQASVEFSMAPLGAEDPGEAIFDVGYERLRLAELAQALELRGIRPRGQATGQNRLQWPLGEFDAYKSEGRIALVPPADIQVATNEIPPETDVLVAGRAGQPADLTTRTFPFGGGVEYSIGDGWTELTNGRLATASTHVVFEGRTRAGAESRIPFKVVSRNWQESDRLMSSVMTAVGAVTNPFAVDGYGTLDGVMLGDVMAPRIEATFNGEAIRAWRVDWGAGRGEFFVENGYLDVRGGHFRRDEAELQVDGLFSLGGTRDDGAEEVNVVVQMASFPASRIRSAFGLTEGYVIDGPATGELHLYGAYRRLFGFGRINLENPTAYGELFDSATAGLRFEGNGVRLDGFEMRKGAGSVTGAAFIEWDASYSFNWDARDIPVETLSLIPEPPEPLSGTLEFNASGVGSFEDPRYEVRGAVRDLFVGDEEIGQVTGRIAVREGALSLDLEGASSRLAVSASGRVELDGGNEADLSFRLANASLDPYVRMFVPELSTDITVVVSGAMRVVGELRDWDRLTAEATVEQARLRLFDYDVRNDGVIRLGADRRVIDIDRLWLAGEGTALALTGSVDVGNDEIALAVDGDASLGILQGFLTDLRGSGDAVVAAKVGGGLGQPVVTGQAEVTNGRIRHFSLPHGLEAINGRITFEPGSVRFDDLSALMGAGPVSIGGRVGLNGYRLGELGITAVGQEMQLRYPEGFRSLLDTDLVLRGPAVAPVLTGVVNVRDAVLLDGLSMSGNGFLGAGGDAEASSVVSVDRGNPLSFDIQIVAPSTVRVTSNTMRVVSSADLTLRGTLDRPLLFGSLELERGEAFVEGNRYRLNYGTIGFANATAIEPFVDVEVETDVRVPGQTYRVMVRATGTFDRIVPTLSSDPPLPEVDILSLLLGDIRDPQSADLRAARAPELAQQQRFQAGAARLLTSPLSSGVGRVVEESFGVDTFQITPSLGDPSAQQSAQLNPTARVLIGKRISDRGHITFSRALSGANRDLIVVLEFDQTDRLAWILSQNEDRTYALDFRVRHAF